MRTGTFVPNLGPAATPAGVARVALRAEELGFDSVWVTERLFQPVKPTIPFAGDPDGVYPEAYRYSLDPLATLAYVAAVTSRVRLGTSILVAPYYNPVLLARSLTTVDVLSGGRLEVGFGIGWHPDEFAAAGIEMDTRAARFEEQLRLIKAIWTENPVAFEGEFFSLPEASVLPKPIQRPHPPISIGAFTKSAARRAARMADGLQPAGTLPLLVQKAFIDEYLDEVAAAGRDPGAANVIVRAQIDLRESDLGSDRLPFSGSYEQILEDLATVAEWQPEWLICDPVYFVAGLSELMERLEQIKALLDACGVAPAQL
jgi:probable F420-dependent oxidoreductase